MKVSPHRPLLYVGFFPEFDHGRANVAAENAIIPSSTRQLNDTRREKETALAAVSPFSALGFPNKIIDGVDRDRATRFYNRLKTSRLPKTWRRLLVGHIKFDPVR